MWNAARETQGPEPAQHHSPGFPPAPSALPPDTRAIWDVHPLQMCFTNTSLHLLEAIRRKLPLTSSLPSLRMDTKAKPSCRAQLTATSNVNVDALLCTALTLSPFAPLSAPAIPLHSHCWKWKAEAAPELEQWLPENRVTRAWICFKR